MALGATGNLAEADRQRIECLSWPPSMGGETWVYDWNYYLVPGASSSGTFAWVLTLHQSLHRRESSSPFSTYADHFFHLSQLLSRDIGGYVIALDLREGRVRILDTIRPTCGGTCPSVAANAFWGRTTYHRMTVTYGEGGRLRCTSTSRCSQPSCSADPSLPNRHRARSCFPRRAPDPAVRLQDSSRHLHPSRLYDQDRLVQVLPQRADGGDGVCRQLQLQEDRVGCLRARWWLVLVQKFHILSWLL